MKYLRLTDHNGVVTLVQQVFVEGPDFEYRFPQPVALWFGKIELLDKLPREEELETWEEIRHLLVAKELEEVKVSEPETVITESSGDTRPITSSELESVENAPQDSAGDNAPERSKRNKGAPKFKGTLGSRLE